ncbi:MAG: acyl-CoA desaturase [Candidatus Paceibacterota bacterium]
MKRLRRLSEQLQILLLVTLPFAGFVYSMYLLWNQGVNWIYVGILLVFFFITARGITIGFHRLFTHGSFETTRFIEAVLAICGSMAIEGSLESWVTRHRTHHTYADKPRDPHSPLHFEHTGKLSGLPRSIAMWFAPTLGFLWAHFLFFFFEKKLDVSAYRERLREDGKQHLVIISKLFPVWVALSMVLPAALGGLLTLSWHGVWLGFVWGCLVRVFLVHHMTWSVNSVCHMFGYRRYDTPDASRNNALLGPISGGEAYHNNHHRHPKSARHGLKWWEFDDSYWTIKLLELLGLARKVNTP